MKQPSHANCLLSGLSSSSSSKPFAPTITHKLRNQLHAIIGFTDLLRYDINRLEDSDMRPKHLPHILAECLDNISEIKQAAFKLEEIVKEFRDAAAVIEPKIENEEESEEGSEEEEFEFTADAANQESMSLNIGSVIDANDPPSARP